MDGKRFENEALKKKKSCATIMKFSDRDFYKNESKMTGDCCVFKFLQRSVDGKHLMHFQSENSICFQISPLMSSIERKYCLISTSYLAGLFDIFMLLHI